MRIVAFILIVSREKALVEGVSQTLCSGGHQVVVAADVPEAADNRRDGKPLSHWSTATSFSRGAMPQMFGLALRAHLR